MKNKIVVMGLTLLLLMMLPLGVLAGENLISNGDFSQLDDSGLPVAGPMRPGTARKRFRPIGRKPARTAARWCGWKTFRKTTPGWNSRSR